MKKYTKEKEDLICKLYDEGKDTVFIADMFNTYNTTIRRILLRNDVILRTQSEVNTKIKKNPFEDLNDPNVQYWLGVLMTDGNVSKERFRIALSLKDVEHLKKYKEFLNGDVKVNSYKNNRYNILEYYVNFQNKIIHNYLINLGITPAKSFDLKINIPITWDMLRGIIDGDGYYRVIKDRLTISMYSASFKFIEQISNFLKINNIKHTIKKQKSDLFVLGIYTQSDVQKCIYNMFNSADTFLDRKYQKIGPTLAKARSKNNPNSVKDSTSNTELAILREL